MSAVLYGWLRVWVEVSISFSANIVIETYVRIGASLNWYRANKVSAFLSLILFLRISISSFA